MGVFSWIVLGLVAGLLAEKATGKRAGGCLTKIAVGVLGGLIGGAVATAAGLDGIDHVGLWSLLLAFAGATALLLALDVKGR
ncbi:MAG: Transglycosylase-associated protein [Actinomycetia bacterium]|nr:Transglycosylase-associated protein [Actinomycetes bacterium]